MSDNLEQIVARIDERTIHILDAQKKHIEDTNKILESHNDRIRKNETALTKAAVIFSFAGALIMVGIKSIWQQITGNS